MLASGSAVSGCRTGKQVARSLRELRACRLQGETTAWSGRGLGLMTPWRKRRGPVGCWPGRCGVRSGKKEGGGPGGRRPDTCGRSRLMLPVQSTDVEHDPGAPSVKSDQKLSF